MSTIFFTRTLICALKDSYNLKASLECEIKSNVSRFLCIFHIQNPSCYANGIFKIIFFQDDYTRAKVTLDFKTRREKLLYRSLIV